MNVCFIAAGPIEWGSSRMRAYWPAKYMADASVVTFAQAKAGNLPPADVYVWQKSADVGIMNQLRDARHVWDVCDPMHWFSPNEARAVVSCVDGLVTSSEALADDLADWCGRRVLPVPDCLDMDHFAGRRMGHENGHTIRFIWFGVSVNRVAIYAALANLLRSCANGYAVELTILDDRPDMPMRDITGAFPVYHARWTLAGEVETIAAHDIALLPAYPGPWGTVKSDNKRQTATACGLPTVSGMDYHAMVHLIESPVSREVRVSKTGIVKAEHAAEEWQRCLQSF